MTDHAEPRANPVTTHGKLPMETYVCLDVETDGEVPGLSSMLSLGAAAVAANRIIDTFSANLERLPGASPHPDTTAWWSRFPEEFKLATKDALPPAHVIQSFVAWLDGFGAQQLVAVGAPATVDFAFVNYYCHRFAGRNPLGYACLDVLSFAMGRLGVNAYWDLEWSIDKVLGTPHDPDLRPHVAVDDAIAQAHTLVSLLQVRSKPAEER